MNKTIWIAMVALAATGCSRGCGSSTEADDGKRMPKPPPPPGVASGAAVVAVHIDVEIDGQTASPIDVAQLNAVKPDFMDEEHRAWKLTTLLGAPADREGALFHAVGDKGVTIVLPRPRSKSDPIPALVVTRRGEPVVAMVSAEEPFPSYHGRGGRLHRPGDPLPRITGVTRIRVTIEQDGGAMTKPAPLASPIHVRIAGRAEESWSAETLARVRELPPEAGAGSGRDAWSLRDLVSSLVGPNARVTAVEGEGGKRAIEKAAWEDTTRIPILRANRDGGVKFRWIERDGTLGEAEVRNVRGIDVEP
jgi:hypothetical protein